MKIGRTRKRKELIPQQKMDENIENKKENIDSLLTVIENIITPPPSPNPMIYLKVGSLSFPLSLEDSPKVGIRENILSFTTPRIQIYSLPPRFLESPPSFLISGLEASSKTSKMIEEIPIEHIEYRQAYPPHQSRGIHLILRNDYASCFFRWSKEEGEKEARSMIDQLGNHDGALTFEEAKKKIKEMTDKKE